MHGIARVRTTEEEKIKKQKERQAKLIVYKTCMEKIFLKRSQKAYDEESLKLTAEVLGDNPDFGTLWNFRREILLSYDTNIEEFLDIELRLTENCLKVNPKSYYAWYHRIWALEKKKNANWNLELGLCNKYLKFDERNFHCWDYRNYVVNKANINLNDEFDYSTQKIQENFSNYSAWHYRSKLLTKLFPNFREMNSEEETKHRDELELVINAAFTDPYDTSAWFYQRWLLGASSKDIGLAVCRVSPEKSYIAFNQSISLNQANFQVDVSVNGSVISGSWKSLSGFQLDVMWILVHDSEIDLTSCSNVEITLIRHDESKDVIICDRGNEYVGYAPISFSNNFGKSVIEELKDQQQSCEQLLELEPDSKWTLLTFAVILNSIDHISNYQKCHELLSELMSLDPMRKNYYKDLLSRWHIQYCLETNFDSVKQGRFKCQSDDDGLVEITKLYYLQYWSACKSVNARGFKLTSRSLSSFQVLQNCQILDLGNNSIESLCGFPSLPELRTIYLDGNNIESNDLQYLKNCEKLETIYLNNKIAVDDFKSIIPSLKSISLRN
ncbi:rab geranylgeranyltransferase subunit alpha [Arctopsyche grandis]|uniref:rab geranylgeranyltransferase subunit alpha n=1 Tax=Arctopsyche grandis TaxID=121162 RepID=UPI00406D76DE